MTLHLSGSDSRQIPCFFAGFLFAISTPLNRANSFLFFRSDEERQFHFYFAFTRKTLASDQRACLMGIERRIYSPTDFFLFTTKKKRNSKSTTRFFEIPNLPSTHPGSAQALHAPPGCVDGAIKPSRVRGCRPSRFFFLLVSLLRCSNLW